MINLEPIGYIQSPFKIKFATPRQGGLAPSARAIIKLNSPTPEGSLQGLEGFSHLWIIFHFHLNTNKKIKGKIFPPRLQGKSIGWAATRTPHRPNNIGMTLAKIESIEGKNIHVSGIDIVDGTPILDIKPYIDSYDRPPIFSQGWTENIEEKKYPVIWSEKAKKEVLKYSVPSQTVQLIEESLSLDPRPHPRKEGIFVTQVENWNFHFLFKNDQILIDNIREYS